MVVLVELAVDLLVDDLVGTVVLVDGIHNPAFNLVEKAVGRAEVEFTLEAWILEEVLDDVAVLDGPVSLVAVVTGAEDSYLDAVAVGVDALVARHGEAVCVILAVGVVERGVASVSGVGRIGEGHFARAVVQADFVRCDVCLEGTSVGSDGICVEYVGGLRQTHTELYGVAVGAGREAVGGAMRELAVSACVHGVVESFLGQCGAETLQGHYAAEVAAAEYDIACSGGTGAEEFYADGGVLHVGGQYGGSHLEAVGGGQCDALGEIGGIDGEFTCVARTVDYDFLCLVLRVGSGGDGSGPECHDRCCCKATDGG